MTHRRRATFVVVAFVAVACSGGDDAAEFDRDEVVVQPDEEVVGTSTAADGTFTVGPADAFTGDVDITVHVPGNADPLGGRWTGTFG